VSHTPIAGCVTVPPDPATIAPPNDLSVVTDFADSTRFLYEGPDAIQLDVAPGVLEAHRVAVVRGRVNSRDGAPLPGVAIRVLDHSEFGHTSTRMDGAFDLAVNGGGLLTVVLEKDGFLPVQRQVDVPWRDYVWADDVVMVGFDAQVTLVQSGSPGPQFARGSEVADADGARRGTVLFPPFTSASMRYPDGTLQPLSSMHVRITEYTIGESGPRAMPAQLPATSAYTYAVELSVDEAITAGASSVIFDRPVQLYVENFLGFPVGSAVPVGYYDRERAVWISSENGTVVEVLAMVDGVAQLDTNGDGLVDDASILSALGVSLEERAQLATLYPMGATLWRVQMDHFSPWDCNWPYGCEAPDACASPDMPKPGDPKPVPDPDCQPGSTIDCQNQALGESIPLVGTPFNLTYRSDRSLGDNAGRTVTAQLTGGSPPAALVGVVFELDVAGQVLRRTFDARANLSGSITWNGRDAFGRQMRGRFPAVAKIGYLFRQAYLRAAEMSRSFAVYSSTNVITGTRLAREPVTFWQTFQLELDIDDDAWKGLGGWGLDAVHSYDPSARVAKLGNGTIRDGASVGDTVRTVAGHTYSWISGSAPPIQDGTAHEAVLANPGPIVVDRDGTILFVDGCTVRRVRNGLVDTIAGRSNCGGYSGEGVPANEATFRGITGIALDSRGILFIADFYAYRVYRVDADGRVRTAVGTGARGFAGDGGPATAAKIDYPTALATGPDGSLYVGDGYNYRVRRVGPDGIIVTVAGNGKSGYSGDGGLATKASITLPRDLAVDRGGKVFLCDRTGNRIRALSADGVIRTVAGTGESGDPFEGERATNARLSSPAQVAVTSKGIVFSTGSAGREIWRIAPDRRLWLVAGPRIAPWLADDYSSLSGSISVRGVADGSDGMIYLTDATAEPQDGGYFTYHNLVRRVEPVFPGNGRAVTGAVALLPTPDGRVVDVFTTSGRHIQSVDATTAVPLYDIGYDQRGRPRTITDHEGDTTTIEWDSGGRPIAVVAPHGQRTVFSTDANGYLRTVTDPAGDTVTVVHDGSGLLRSLTDPRGYIHTFDYDDVGRLTRDTNPGGGFRELSRIEGDSSYSVVSSTALGRTSTFDVHDTPNSTDRLNTSPDGRVQHVATTPTSRTVQYPDGTVVTSALSPDPRFGIVAPVASTTVRTPANHQLSIQETRAAVLADPQNPLSATSLTRTLTVNGRAWTTNYSTATRQVTSTSPAGRTAIGTFDEYGRVSTIALPGTLPTQFHYDSHGRVASATQGARIATFEYDAQGNLWRVTRPDGRQSTFSYDQDGRATNAVLPGNRNVGVSYYRGGARESIKPPGRPAHTYWSDPAAREATYSAPPSSPTGATSSWTYLYDLDGALATTLLPDATMDVPSYDAAGRIAAIETDRGSTSFDYDTAGRIAFIGGSDIGVLLGYDGPFRTSEVWTGTVAGAVGHGLDDQFRIVSQAVNGRPLATFHYDADGFLDRAGALTIGRQAATGRIDSTSIGIVETNYSYTAYGEPSTATVTANGSPVFGYSLHRDSTGRVIGKTEVIEGVTTEYGYGYDYAGRLETVSANGGVVASYAYDANGNRTLKTTAAGSESGTYDDQDRILSYGDETLVSGARGELQSRSGPSGTTLYDYDSFGNLRGARKSNGAFIEYLVDGLNRRVGKKVNGTLTEAFLYEGQLRPAAWLDGSGAVKATFIYGLHLNVPEYMVAADGTTYRFLADHLGSPRLIVNTSTGAVVQRIDYDEWGQVLNDTNPGFQPFGFAGGLNDLDTALVRFGARDYDPSTGRWTTRDRSRFRGGLNFYQYVGSDPVNFIDPRGKMQLPADPSGLGPDWTLDPTHLDPNGSLWRHPSGDFLEFNKGRPGMPGWRGRDHWHQNGNHDEHLNPGDVVPDPAPQCGEPVPDTSPVGEPEEDLLDEIEFSPAPAEVVVPVTLTAIILEILMDAGIILVF
jgi:RHS repeat-associated protein